MEPAQPNTNCANFWRSRSPVGNCRTLSSSSKQSRAPASASSKRLRSANSSPGGDGKPDLGTVTRVDAHILRGEVARPITRRRAAGVQVHNNVHMLFQ